MASLFQRSTLQNMLGFPEPLTEKYRPRKFDDFVGLEKIRKCMARLAAQPFQSAWLFIGPSGTGKTTMALALAEAIPAELHHIPSQECNLENIERVRRLDRLNAELRVAGGEVSSDRRALLCHA